MGTEETRSPGADWTGRKTLALYVAAGVVYILLGAFVPELLFSWWEGVPFLLLFVAAAHKLRNRRS